MTELMNIAQLRELAADAGQLAAARPNMVPVMRWALDEATGRAVGFWVLEDKQARPQATFEV